MKFKDILKEEITKFNVKFKLKKDEHGKKEYDVYCNNILIGEYGYYKQMSNQGTRLRYATKMVMQYYFHWDKQGLKKLLNMDDITIGGTAGYETRGLDFYHMEMKTNKEKIEKILNDFVKYKRK